MGLLKMNWSNSWSQPVIENPEPATPWDHWNQDQVLMEWQKTKETLSKAKEDEMALRKYCVKRAFVKTEEGTNTLDLGNGYALKAVIKYNYNLADNDTVEAGLNEISKIGNEGSFIADRLVSWTPNFLVSEYRTLQENAEKGEGTAIAILSIVNKFLTITEGAPTLDIKEPKEKKK